MDRAKHRATTAYGGRAQEGVLEVFMSFMLCASLALRWKLWFYYPKKKKTVVLTITESMIVEWLELVMQLDIECKSAICPCEIKKKESKVHGYETFLNFEVSLSLLLGWPLKFKF